MPVKLLEDSDKLPGLKMMGACPGSKARAEEVRKKANEDEVQKNSFANYLSLLTRL